MSKNSVLCNLNRIIYFDPRKNLLEWFKDYIFDTQWFRFTCIILHNFQGTNCQTLLEKLILESAQQTNKIDLNCFLINRQWFSMAYIILYNLQNASSQILPTKKISSYLITDYLQKKRKKKRKIQNIFASMYWEF